MDDGTTYQSKEDRYNRRVKSFVNLCVVVFVFSLGVFGMIYGIKSYVHLRDAKTSTEINSEDFPPRDIMPNVYDTKQVLRFEKTICFGCHGR